MIKKISSKKHWLCLSVAALTLVSASGCVRAEELKAPKLQTLIKVATPKTDVDPDFYLPVVANTSATVGDHSNGDSGNGSTQGDANNNKEVKKSKSSKASNKIKNKKTNGVTPVVVANPFLTPDQKGAALYNQRQYAQAWAQWSECAFKENTQCESRIGEVYLKSDDKMGVEKNEKKALIWLNKAAYKGEPHAQYLLYDMYRVGFDVPGIGRVSNRWLEASAYGGHATAQNDLAVAYLTGDTGRRPNIAKALEWYEKSAKNGNVNAQAFLGSVLLQGLYGRPRDTEQAIVWLEKSAAQSHPQAQLLLFDIYFNGLDTPIDLMRAHALIENLEKNPLAAQGDVILRAKALQSEVSPLDLMSHPDKN